MSNPLPVRIAVQPIAQAWQGKPVHMRFGNDGSLTVRVQASPVVLNTGSKGCVPHAMPAVKVTPSTFTVKPYGGQTVIVTVPGSGAHDYGVLFIADAVAGGKKSVTVEAAVGSQITTHGHLTCGNKLAEAAPGSASFPSMLILMIVLLSLALGLATWGIILRRRHHQRGVNA